MKKILNDPAHYVDEMLDGLSPRIPTSTRGRRAAASSPAPAARRRARSASSPAAARATCRSSPAMSARACSTPAPSATSSPRPRAEQMADAMRAANGGAGVLRLYGNYGGDVMNFDMAGEMVEMEDIQPHHGAARRRRRLRAAGGGGEAPRRRRHGLRLQDRRRRGRGRWPTSTRSPRVAQKAADACRSIGVALTPCTVPAGRQAHLRRSARTRWRSAWASTASRASGAASCRPADAIADEMMDRLLADMPLAARRPRLGPGQLPRRDAARGALHPVPPRQARGSSELGRRRSSCRSSAATPPRWR